MKYPIVEAAEKLRNHPYRDEAEAILEIATGRRPTPVESVSTLRVADWLREFVAAYASGCTGLATDPDGPSLVLRRDEALDGLREGAEDEEALRDTPDLSAIPSIADWVRIRRQERLRAGESLTDLQREVMEELEREGAIYRIDEDEEPERHPDAYPYGESWGPDNPAPGSPWSKARGAVPRPPGSPRAEEVIRKLRDGDLDME